MRENPHEIDGNIELGFFKSELNSELSRLDKVSSFLFCLFSLGEGVRGKGKVLLVIPAVLIFRHRITVLCENC